MLSLELFTTLLSVKFFLINPDLEKVKRAIKDAIESEAKKLRITVGTVRT
ncbi:MAG: hypothetical protein H0X70_07545 [Segetibacter sp.]|jgi:hypothetical protein|nr:hypothetical protein [Segetibacter sp.]